MTGIFRQLILLFFFSSLAFAVQAQVRFTASISPGQISSNEYAVLRLEVQNADNIEEIVPPSLKDFVVISGPNQESGMSNVNGLIKQYFAISYILQAQRTGTISISAATCKVRSKVFKSNLLKLLVKKGRGTGPTQAAIIHPFGVPEASANPGHPDDLTDYVLKKGENVQDKVNRNMQLKLHVNKNSCYVGEPIVATYKLYTRLKSDSKLSKIPAFNGFSVIDLQKPDETEYAKEKLNNREYNVYTIRKSQLYPLQDGQIELESAVLDNSIQFLKADGALNPLQTMQGFFDGVGVSPDAVINENVSLSNKPVSITVKPLPEKGKPAGFKGAVGKFNISGKLEKNSFSSNETGKLTVVISGSGNLQLLTAPEIRWPVGVETFEAKEEEALEHMTVPVSGQKIFQIPFSVDSPGTYTIPEIEFSYFDPSAVAYKILHIPTQQFRVSRAVAPKPIPEAAIAKQSVGFSKQLFDNRSLIVGALALLMITGIIVWLRNERKAEAAKQSLLSEEEVRVTEPIASQIHPVSFNLQNPLGKSGDCLNNSDCSQFYSLLYGELKEWLGAKYELKKNELNIKTITAVLDRAGIENSVVLQLQQLLQEIEWQLYTPFERNEEMAVYYSRAQELIKSISNEETIIL